MVNIPKRVAERLSKQLTVYQKVIENAKNRDVNESDTVTIITDMLADIFGFDKYTEVTSEQCIRGTYCDLAVKLDGSVKYLIEVKAIGLTLKESHLRQAMNYGANQGIPWVVITNGNDWEIHRIKFERPIGCERTCAINILELNPRKSADIERLYLLCKEGLVRDVITEFHQHSQIVNRFVVAAAIRSDTVVSVIRREIRKLATGANVSAEEIAAILPDVLKRDVIEGEAAKDAERRVGRAGRKSARVREQRATEMTITGDPPAAPIAQA